ncbi:MAG: type II toxin-antitoxin system HicB family antitoxin [Anaerovibrio sp.]|uniref:type II toxin-antitoxin system HicB family antitoxin n=1 Tax=Anaerovibrio sp. TaxID=1872532 RepID=UPI0025F39989|nr:type II toxin-antitoxin system HicB family antitoxin [Anaerovibrio sp.]MCR5177322.1 type II toxin-antitoxin system HicB family antitoxin [Anaerovibrio sp.]
MKKMYYPAVFHPEEDGGYSVHFPDLLGCVTEGDTMQEAIEMAEDALGIYLYTLKEDKEEIPAATNPADIKTEGRDFVSMVIYDEVEYLKRTDSHAVKKNCTIPAWLDTLARESNVNFSQLLQNAIKKELNIV